MTAQTMEAVRRSVTVSAPRERAFDLFTQGMTSWWPLSTHHIGAADAVEVVLEPRAGGRWFERGTDGSESEWGRVIAHERPERILLAWHLDHEWRYDPEVFSEVEVRFVAEGQASTRVELEHRGFEVYGAHAHEVRDPVAGEGGWAGLLELYSAAAGS
jgi:uncharacterized protein YndB with AHSA1/START domain